MSQNSVSFNGASNRQVRRLTSKLVSEVANCHLNQNHHCDYASVVKKLNATGRPGFVIDAIIDKISKAPKRDDAFSIGLYGLALRFAKTKKDASKILGALDNHFKAYSEIDNAKLRKNLLTWFHMIAEDSPFTTFDIKEATRMKKYKLFKSIV